MGLAGLGQGLSEPSSKHLQAGLEWAKAFEGLKNQTRPLLGPSRVE